MSSRRLYQGRYAWALGALFGLLALVGVDGVAMGGGGPGPLAFFASMAAVSLVLAVRGWRSGSVAVSEQGVELRTLLRTRRLAWSQVQAFGTETGQVGAYQRTYLVARRSDGGRLALREINSAPPRQGKPARLDALAAELNAELRRRTAA